MALGYRTSIFKTSGDIVLSAEFELARDDKNLIRERMDDYFTRRREKQPLEYPSAGSTFKRPEGYFAGALIQKNNLKGVSVGGAQVSEKHAGFVINKCDATCSDVLSLIKKIQKTVLDADGVSLETEVIFIGRND
jgi:UDP-N-acetylmuramate dehydrogenase